jgi:hypothetical protein
MKHGECVGEMEDGKLEAYMKALLCMTLVVGHYYLPHNVISWLS